MDRNAKISLCIHNVIFGIAGMRKLLEVCHKLIQQKRCFII
ncbi:hypothetical protein [Rickettsia endosymbiont of Oedothorax gibbosus]|nr:hypothetical protein [Rickettsia endosymbiont of Oedothorax gibbosus]